MTDFESWLQKGLGRAAVLLKANDSRMWREQLLYACTHDLTYDRQFEEGRAPYLEKLIEISGDAEFYRDRIIACLANDDDDLDLTQIFELAASFANQCSAARNAMYAAFDRCGFAGAGIGCAELLVVLDGLSGLLFTMKSFGEVEAEERPWQFGHLVDALNRHHGEQPLPANLNPFLQEWQEHERLWELGRRKEPKPRSDYATLKETLTRSGAMAWARNATPGELALAAEDLRLETDEKRIICYLWMFRRHAFPEPIDRLLELAGGKNPEVARAALVALGNVVDQRVRDLALSLIAERRRIDFAVGLLVQNRDRDDYPALEELLADHSYDASVYHGLGIDVREFVKAHRSEEAERSLLLLYENGPCSLCRHGAVEELIAMDRLPAGFRDECAYDAYSETRQLVGHAGASGGAPGWT